MRVWLDDLRPAPEGWAHARTRAEAIALIQAGGVATIRLDHDLGEPESEVGSGGHGVAVWIEAHAALGNLPPLTYTVHSANPVGRARRLAALHAAERFWGR